MNYISILWFSSALFFLVCEIANPGLFFFLSFFFGSLGAAGLAFLSYSLMHQALVFFVVSTIAFLILKQVVIMTGRHAKHTNVAALIGKKGITLKTINVNDFGLVKIGGEIWSARTMEKTIHEGKQIEVVRVSGAHLIVKEII